MVRANLSAGDISALELLQYLRLDNTGPTFQWEYTAYATFVARPVTHIYLLQNTVKSLLLHSEVSEMEL